MLQYSYIEKDFASFIPQLTPFCELHEDREIGQKMIKFDIGGRSLLGCTGMDLFLREIKFQQLAYLKLII